MTAELTMFEGHDLSIVPTGHSSTTSGVGFVYAAEFESGMVKVGRSLTPRDRMRVHCAQATELDGPLRRGWVSPAHVNHVETEKVLIACGQMIARWWRRKEYFYGTRLEDFTGLGRAMAYVLPPAPQPRTPQPSQSNDHSEGLTIREVARRLEKDRSTIRRWINRGYLRGKQLGGRTYVTADELDRFLREGQS